MLLQIAYEPNLLLALSALLFPHSRICYIKKYPRRRGTELKNGISVNSPVLLLVSLFITSSYTLVTVSKKYPIMIVITN